ncbi:MAG: aldolase catalytic domain-containing protein [Treponema sp.]|nr:aldolase catalytic domain-containing protein [Spirochaetia bacterium]MDD7013675.1 aldolase catalytic domain-containing protein [Spirochaetales bacterium]MDY4902110.1 aldolase catalytic domain-containing protein [Treponema sp.]
MKDISELMNFRPSIKVLDATLRDGGLVNDFYFPEGFAKALYEANVKSGVDYMEFGYRADKSMFDVEKFGPCKFSDDEYIRSVIGSEKSEKVKLAIMADVGRCNYKEDIHERSESPVDLIRVATYLHQIPAAVEMIEDAHRKGYETSCNIMALSTGQENDIKAALDIIGKSPVDIIYIVDSYGSIYPEQMARVCDIFAEFSAKYNKKLGIHAHDNQKLAFANTIECVGDGVDYLDATYMQMGRGAGNCAMELLLGFLKNPKYNIYPVFEFIQNHMVDLKKKGITWGYDIQYVVTGILNQHPRTAIAFTKDNRTDYADFYKEIISQD